MARNKGQAVERMKVVNRRLRESVTEDGVMPRDGVMVPMYLDSTGDVCFVFLLPEYVSTALSLKDRVTGKTAAEAEKLYGEALRKYVQWKRTAVAELVILAAISYVGATEKGDRSVISIDKLGYAARHTGVLKDYVLSSKHEIGLEWKTVFRVNKELYEREPVMDLDEPLEERMPDQDWPNWRQPKPVDPPQWKPGAKLGVQAARASATVFPYSPELEAKLTMVCTAIDQAARVLHQVASAEDVSAALLGLDSNTLLLR